MADESMNLPDMLGILSDDLKKALAEKRYEDANKIISDMADLVDPGRSDFPANEEQFVERWYNEGW